MENHNLDAVIVLTPESIKYFGYEQWADATRNWMLEPGGDSSNAYLNICIIPFGEKPLFILNSFTLSFFNGNLKRVLPYGHFFKEITSDLKKIENKQSEKIIEKLKSGIFINQNEALTYLLKKLNLKNSRIAIECDGVNKKKLETIKSTLEKNKLFDGSELLRLTRMIKTADEINLLKKCFGLTESALIDTIKIIKPKITMGELIDYYKNYIESKGASYQHLSLLALGQGMTESRDYSLNKNMIMGFDAGIILDKYISDTGLTVFWGSYKKSDLVMYDKLYDIVKYGFDAIKPGVNCSRVYHIMKSICEKNDLTNATFEGHGIGLSFREYPIINDKIKYKYFNGFNEVDADFIIEENMIINLELGYHYLGEETYQIEKTVQVTKTGNKQIVSQNRKCPFLI